MLITIFFLIKTFGANELPLVLPLLDTDGKILLLLNLL